MKTEIQKVKELGEEIGYGHLMSLASALWRKQLSESGTVTGALFPITVDCIVKDNDVQKIVKDEIKLYDKIVSPPVPMSNHYFKE